MSLSLSAQNPGEMVFSKQMISLPEIELPTNEFRSGDAIYSVARFSASLQTLANARPDSKVEVEVHLYVIKPPLYSYQQPMEEYLVSSNMKVSGKLLQNDFLLVDIVPEPDQMTAFGTPEITYREFGKKYEGPVAFAETLANLPSGSNSIKVVLKCNYEDIAAGTMSLEGDDFSIYAQKSQSINLAAASAGARSAVFPEAKMKNEAIEKQMIAAVMNSNDWKTGFIDGTEVLKISIIDPDWHIRRHELTGIILHRYIRAAIAVKTKSGGCAYYTITYQEDYIGDKFQPLRYDGTTVKTDISCENLR